MPTTPAPLIDRLAELLLGGDPLALDREAIDLRRAGWTTPGLIEDLLAPALRALGDPRPARLTPARVQAAAVAAGRVLDRLGPSGPGTRGRLILVTGDAERHRLPGRFAAQLLRHEGWQVDETASPIGRTASGRRSGEEPAAVLLSCSTAANLLACADAIRAIHLAGHRVLVGGGAFGDDGTAARAIGADGWSPTAAASGPLLDAWIADPAPASFCRPVPLREARELERAGHRLSAQVAGELVGRRARSRPEARQMAAEVRATIDVVGAATIAGVQILVGHADRLGVLDLGGAGPAFGRDVLEAVRRALPPGCTGAAAAVEAALAATALSAADRR